MTFYIDIDYFFSIGTLTANRAFNYGGRIDQIIPIGSLFMEYYWFNKPKPLEKKIDLIMLGINTMNAINRLDKYESFLKDYYDSIRWLVMFKNEFPELKVAIKHHKSAGVDKIEEKIISESGVELLLKSSNSYELAFQSRCVVTYGSTMGYEMAAHGVPSFFVDPGANNTFVADLRENKKLNRILLEDFKSYKKNIYSAIKNQNSYDFKSLMTNQICLDSTSAVKNIYNKLS